MGKMPWLVTRRQSQSCNFINVGKLPNIDNVSKVSHRESTCLFAVTSSGADIGSGVRWKEEKAKNSAGDFKEIVRFLRTSGVKYPRQWWTGLEWLVGFSHARYSYPKQSNFESSSINIR